MVSSGLSGDNRFLPFSDFLSQLKTVATGTTPDWIQDGLSSIPTWDTVQDRFGTVRQGIIRSPSFVLHMTDGATEIPYASIIKLEIEYELDGSHSARVTFRGEQTITGTLGDQDIILSHKGHKTTFKLNEMRVVCPTYLLFTV